MPAFSQDLEPYTRHLPDLHGHLQKRDNLADLFAPRPSIDFDFLSDPNAPTTFTISLGSHNRSYINIEQLEPLLVGFSGCAEPYDGDHSALISLSFADEPHFAAAADAWQGRDDLLFVLEHESCFEGRGERTVYRPWFISFHNDTKTVLLDVKPLPADLMMPWTGFATRFVAKQDLRRDDVHYVRRDPFPLAKLRRRSGGGLFSKIGHLITELGDGVKDFFTEGKIDFDHTFTFTHEWGERKKLLGRSKEFGQRNTIGGLPEVHCVNCHAKGKVAAKVFFDFDLEHVDEDEYRNAATEAARNCENEDSEIARSSCQKQSAQSRKRSVHDVRAAMEEVKEQPRAARRSYTLKAKPETLRRRQEKKSCEDQYRCGGFSGFLDDPFDCMDKKLNSMPARFTDMVTCPDGYVEQGLTEIAHHTTEAIGFAASKLSKVAGLDSDGDFLDFDGIFRVLIDKHLAAAYLQVEVVEDVDVSYQLEFAAALGMELTVGLDFYPPPTPAVIPFASLTFEVQGFKNKAEVDFYNLAQGKFSGLLGDFKNDKFFKTKGNVPGLKPNGEFGYSKTGWGPDKDSNNKFRWLPKANGKSGVDRPKGFRGSKTPKTTGNGVGIYPIEAAPLSIQIQMGIRGAIVAKLPGFQAKFKAGSYWRHDFKTGETSKRLDGDLNTLAADVEIEDPSVYFNFMAGPKIYFGLAHNFLMGMPANLRPTVGMGARADIVRFDISGGEKSGVGGDCLPVEKDTPPSGHSTNSTARNVTVPPEYTIKLEPSANKPVPTTPTGSDLTVTSSYDSPPTVTRFSQPDDNHHGGGARVVTVREWEKRSSPPAANTTELEEDEKMFGITVVFRTGIYVYAQFLTAVIDTNWIGQLDKKPKGTRGLYWSKQLYGICCPCHGMCVSDFVNKISGKIFDGINDILQNGMDGLTDGLFESPGGQGREAELDDMAMRAKEETDIEMNNELGISNWSPKGVKDAEGHQQW